MNLHILFWLYWVSQTVITGTKLGIFDRLAAGPQTTQQVASALKLDPDATGRLLTALAALRLLQQQGALFWNSPAAIAQLVSSSPLYIGGIAAQHGDQLWPLWEHLPTAIREGRPVLREAFGGDRNPFDILSATPESLTKLIAGMDAGAKGFDQALRSAHDFRLHRRLVDVGGCTGVVTAPLAQAFPHLEVILFDLPKTCSMVRPLLPRYGCGQRIRVHGGDFFRAETFPAGCDAAVICRVLHDWSDEKALAILRNLNRALLPGGVVLIIEYLMDTDDPELRPFVALSNLTMLVLTDGGRERTAVEYTHLLRLAGFADAGTVRMGSLGVIKGQKV